MNNLLKRKTVLCTWELGGQLGHIALLSHLCQALESHGYDCVVALRDLSRAAPFFHGSNVRLLQAPVFLPKISMQRPVVCLADTLLLSGYLKRDELQGLLQAWHNLISLVNPDILLLDYAPTAALAARSIPCRKMVIGSGFWQPVPGHPIRSWHPNKEQGELVQRQEELVTATINGVLQTRRESPLRYISDVFASDRTFITTPPEFDLYADIRKNGIYHCKSGTSGITKPVRFGDDSRPKVLAYLKPAHPQIDTIIKGLAKCHANVFVACPRFDSKRLEPYQSEHFNFSVEPVQLAQYMCEAAVFISHGNYGATVESILAGTPVLALPIQLEQLLTSQTLDHLNIGQAILKLESEEQLVSAVHALLSSKTIKENALKFAQKHSGLISVPLNEVVTEECDALLGK